MRQTSVLTNGSDIGPVAHRPGTCPGCGHPAGAPGRRSLLQLVLHRAPGPATCRRSDGVDDPSGWPTECGCQHAFHGS